MWKLLHDSVRGTSHERSGQPCQDHAFASTIRTEDGTLLLASCADGAGTAEKSELGSRLATETIIQLVTTELEGGLLVESIDAEKMLGWYRAVQSRLKQDAYSQQVTLRDYACTLLTAIVGERAAAFAQIGDGAIVIGSEGAYELAFWPQTGEYANTTNFLTDDALAERLAFHARAAPVDELALLTDGLQMLALRYSDRGVHTPFFLPMFRLLRKTANAGDLIIPLRQFLTSERVIERTDDDKTLVLATRRDSDADENSL